MNRLLITSLFLLLPLWVFGQEYDFREVPLWEDGKIPFNKEGISLPETVDSTGRRIRQISVPRLYVYTRKGLSAKGPAFMYIPGGGYSVVSLRDKGESYARRFLQYGFDVVSILVYRLPDARIVNEQSRVPLCDAQKALSLLHENAEEWNIDTRNIGVMGGSAGGHLAASLANLTEEPVAPGVHPEHLKMKFSILLYPVISFNLPHRHGGSYRRLLGDRSEDTELLDFYSMENQVSEKTPPTLLIHARDDASVSYQNSLLYLEEMQKKGVPGHYIELQKGGHGFGFNLSRVDRDWTPELESWIREQLEDRPASGGTFMDPDLLASFREVEKDRILRLAGDYLDEEPQAITNWTSDRSAGGPNDFYSEGDYWWPDPDHPDGPYIRRDGLTNPEIFTAHRHAMIRMSQITGVLASAYLLTGEEKYAERAMAHFRPWFIDKSTRMNPHMLYAQAIKGRYTGRGIGIIDAMHLVEPALAIKSMEHSSSITGKELEEMKSWFGEFLDWIYTHEYGMSEMIHPNNHGTCWALQAAAFAYLSGDLDMLSLISRRYLEELLPSQMAGDGSFPLELERTKPYGYSIFNLDAMSALVQILSLSGGKLFPYALEDGRSLRRGMDFLFPYVRNKEEWPYARDVLHYDAYPVRQAFLLFGALAYGLPDYLEVWKGLESDPENGEVVRNTIVKNPMLWTAMDPDGEKFDVLTSSVSAHGATVLDIPDGSWGNKGSISFECRLSEEALSGSTVLLESPVLRLTLRGNFIWPELTAAPTPEGERKERIQFAFFNPGQWYHMTISWDGPGEKIQLYLNGEPQQRAIADRWTRENFSGPLVLGGSEVEIRKVEILGGFVNDAIAAKLVRDLDLVPLAGEGRTLPGGTLDLGDHKLRLVYEADFSEQPRMVHEEDLFRKDKRKKLPKDAVWVLEGRASAEIRDGAIVVTNSPEGNAISNHSVLWNTEVFPENFLLEFDMTPRDPGRGLAIIFFCSTSREDGESVFSKGLPKREGDFTRYNRGAINCYHTSYWASSGGGSRLTTNLRKNHGFKLVALGNENIAASTMYEQSSEQGPFRVRLLKTGNRIEVETRGERVLVWEDDGQEYGPVYGEGQIGLRQMGHAGQVRYHSFRVYEVY